MNTMYLTEDFLPEIFNQVQPETNIGIKAIEGREIFA